MVIAWNPIDGPRQPLYKPYWLDKSESFSSCCFVNLREHKHRAASRTIFVCAKTHPGCQLSLQGYMRGTGGTITRPMYGSRTAMGHSLSNYQLVYFMSTAS